MAYNAMNNGSITAALFDQWLQLNCGNYYTDQSEFALKLYKDRLKDIHPTLRDYEFKRKSIRSRNDHCLELPDCIVFTNCPIHDMPRIQFRHLRMNKNIRAHQLLVVQSLYPAASKADGKKTNIAIHYLVASMLRKGQLQDLNAVFKLFAVGTYESIIVMHLINRLGNDEAKRFQTLMAEDKACCITPTQYFNYAKAIGLAARRSARWVDGMFLNQTQVCLLSYWEMCTGRSGHTSDWKKEIKNRCHSYLPLKRPELSQDADEHTNKEVVEALRPILKDIFRTIIREPSRESFEEFCLRRQTWCAGGTAAGEYLVHDGNKIRLDKRSLFETLDHSDMVAMLTSTPEIKAVASEKFEIGKSRAIYGTTVKSYAIITYVIGRIEPNLNYVTGLESGLSGMPEIVAINNRLRVCARPGTYTTMVDYEDFNLQHSLLVQHTMFDVMAEVYKDIGAHQDYVTAANWAADACLNQSARFPGEQEYRKITQGMFSGVRSTDFMNTILNLAYGKYSMDKVRELFGEEPYHLYQLHKGDDVWISNSNLLFAVALYIVMQCSNLKFQDLKQLFSICVGEFLRVRYSAEGLLGYLCRAIGAFIERPLQGSDDTLPPNILRSLNSQIMIMHRRGLKSETCTQLWEVACDQWHSLHTQTGKNITIPRYVIEQSDEYNGLDLGPPLTYSTSGTKINKMPVMKGLVASVIEALPQHMTDDYITYLSNTVQGKFDSKQVSSDVHRINTVGLVSQADRYRALQEYVHAVVKWKAALPPTGHYTRTKEEYLVQTDTAIYDKDTFLLIRRKLNYDISEVINDDRTIMGDIYKAIHSSPFRSVTLAERAFNMGIIESTKVCISLNPLEEVSTAGNRALNILLDHIDRSVVIELLKGIRGCGIAFESQLHPNILSWAHRHAVDRAINICINARIRTCTGWRRVLKSSTISVVRAIMKEGSMLRISQY